MKKLLTIAILAAAAVAVPLVMAQNAGQTAPQQGDQADKAAQSEADAKAKRRAQANADRYRLLKNSCTQTWLLSADKWREPAVQRQQCTNIRLLFRSASGRAPAASANPPVLMNGNISAVTARIRIWRLREPHDLPGKGGHYLSC